jgi:H/ACA ribonucleoprotein complex subunit 4
MAHKIDEQKILKKPIPELINFSIINMDKPTGPTSFSVDLFVKRALGLSKTSHLGTLDPMVTGVLPIALGRACRLNDYFMHRDKVYVGVMRLHKDVPDSELEREIKNFIGKIMQLPPVKSRVKRELREREIKRFEVLERDGKDVLFIADVQAGTYIRKLVSDLGEKIGGAHMLELRRTRASVFSEEDSSFVNLYDFEKAVEAYEKSGDEKLLRKILIPAELALLKVMPAVQLNDNDIKQILTGKPLMKADFAESLFADARSTATSVRMPAARANQRQTEHEELFAAFIKDRFIGVYKRVKEGDIIARPEFVFN